MAGEATHSEPARLPVAQRLKHFNGMLVFIMLYMAFCAFNFGFDVGTFGGVQAMHSFTSKFGECDEKGVCALPGWLSSVMTATPFLGKAAGCIACGWIAEKWGRRAAILGICIVSFVGVALQTSATTAAQFTIGRIITYAMTGMAIVVIPIYSAEVSPRVLRGMFGSTIQVMIIFGQVISTLITYGTKGIDSAAGWRIPVGLQLVVPGIIFALLPFLPESPRWLLSRGRRDETVVSLKKLRKAATEDEVQMEIEALAFAHAHDEQGTWAEVFDAKNRVRTAVAVLAMFGQQITGQAFPSQYGVIFYQSQGYGDKSFLFNVISNITSMVAVIITWFYVDSSGRRPVLMLGGFLMGAFLFILGGVGTVNMGSINQHEKELMVASVMLFQFFYCLSWAPVSYVVLSETAALRLKEKTNLLASVLSVLTTFVTSFTVPYLINAKYANLGGKVGFIYGSFNFVMVVLVYFFIPELKGRTLEEVDQLFASGAPLRKFGKIKTKTATQMYEEDFKRGGVLEERTERVEKV
ncbi:general substrate transporter [Achaetomium macrosporum]|uniref:General substrate transporter n=1 Tax=Achaetomium macrosporum TaxID=79813 RepID=A0AAN7C398_9PEZI|nr:general substrate transporter [Achaetomium macrosporum]